MKLGPSLGNHGVNGAITVVTVVDNCLGFGRGWWGRGVGGSVHCCVLDSGGSGCDRKTGLRLGGNRLNGPWLGGNCVGGFSLGPGRRRFECGVGAEMIENLFKRTSARIVIGRGVQFLGLFLVGFLNYKGPRVRVPF